MSVKRNRQTMSRVAIALVFVMACVGIVPLSASNAQDSLTWRAEYFANPSLTGAPTLVVDEISPNINHDWQHGSPGAGIPVDHFSARWTTSAPFANGTYLFKAYTDDGVRLWINGQLIIDQWQNQTATLTQQQVSLSAGFHSIRIEYYENIGAAIALIWWELLSTPTAAQSWRAEYFNNPWLIGAPVVVREETEINHNWGTGAPVPGVGSDHFSVRWTGNIYFGANDNYTFSVTSDDGVRIWIDGGLLLEQWRDQSATTVSVTRYVSQGVHPIIVEYYEATGTASISFTWKAGTATPVTPTTPATQPGAEIIVDNRDAGFQKGGPASSWYEAAVGYKGHTYWTYNSDSQIYNFAKWVPVLPRAGNYQVYVFIPRQRADTKSARYKIFHGGQQHSFSVNQSLYFDQWVSLGTYYFAGGGNEYVYLDDVTGEPYASRRIAFDAVKFVAPGVVVPSPIPTQTPTTPIAPTRTPWVVTATPPPPTQTPIVVTATPITPAPTVTLPACPITPILGFGRIWTTYATVRNRLGCPAELETNTWSAEQTFLGGYMFWRGDLRLIYALYNNGTWQSFIDTWAEGQAEQDPSILAPTGYYQPKRGFGKVWRDQAGVRDKLSWATTEERGLGASWQAYQGGLMFWSNTLGFFVLYNDGTWSHYY
ncbi:MAG: hypothetical protein FJ026_08530 [Chloroflexi bacterium]|nr:hypothetical protein [Chloroflexota bacterium]